MERADLDQWRAREVARLLTLVETQRRYYQEIVASVPVGLLVLSSDLAIILANTAIRHIFGWTTSESMRRRLDTLLPGWVLDRVEEVLKTGVPQINLMLEIEREPRRRVRIGILVIRNWDDEAAREALLTIEDLTDLEAWPSVPIAPAAITEPVAETTREEAPAPIAEPAIGLSELIDNVDVVIWALKVESQQFIFASRQGEKLLGFPASHWIEHASFWAERIHPVDRERVLESYQRAIDRREGYIGEFRALTADGRFLWLRENARLLFDANGDPEFLVGISVDVTERRLLERQLAQSERVEAVTKLASRMAHDLNNMLMILTGYGEELLNGLPAASSLRADVQEVLGAAERMSGLTSQLLAFARRQSAAVEPLALEAALGGLARRLSAAAGPDVLLELKPSDERNYVKTDLGQLEQVLDALVKHVAQRAPVGGSLRIETSRVEICEESTDPAGPLRRGEYVEISITAPRRTDGGMTHPVAFETFLNGKNPSDDSSALAQAYGMVRQWGGDLAALDEPGERSGFRVFLERVEFSPAEVREAAPEPEAVGAQINLVVTDMLMPRMGGRELVERLHEKAPAMKVLYISGYTEDAAVYARDLPPGTGFLQKPFTLGSLLEKVKEILAAK
ncbi:MAG: PAS domain S-box protein [Bryobacteraceae bacterium]